MDKRLVDFIEGGLDAAASGFVYPRSLHEAAGARVFVARGEAEDVLVAEASLGFAGEALQAGGVGWSVCRETHENAARLRELFPFTAPSPVLKRPRTVGVGDRLGLATPGHIRVFERCDAFPVFAQQSIRELTLTGRSFEDVIDCVSFAVFREDFRRPFGADGDHLKTFEEIEYALKSGCTMITLDCSEHIRDGEAMDGEALRTLCPPDPERERKYLNGSFDVNGVAISFRPEELLRIRATYDEAIDFAALVYRRYFSGRADAPDFEVSIDETATPTTPAQHFYIARELFDRGVRPDTIAPRFCGEFQKGIDYMGDLAQFEREIEQHAKLAEHFGYKLSVHSGSDKFSVFELVGRYTKGRFHLKTAGTNWLEAMAIIAEHDPALYREVHAFALSTAFEQARRYYHVTTDISKVPPLETLTDDELPSLFTQNDARQLIHITYGIILTEKNADGGYRFRDRLYADWRRYDEEYAARLDRHIGRHIDRLYAGFEG